MIGKLRHNIQKLLKRSYDFYMAYGIVSFFVVMLLVAIVGFIGRNNAIKQQQKQIEELCEDVSHEVVRSVDNYVNNLKKVANWFIQIGNPELNFKLSREQAFVILSENIANEVNMKSLSMIWEPNLFDGEDEKYCSTDFHDSTGRFIPYFKKNGDGIVEHDVVANYNDKEDVNSYYYYKTKKNISLGEPHLIRENAKNVMILPIVVPLRFGTKLLGVVSAEYLIDEISVNLETLNLPKEYEIFVFTSHGKILAAPAKKLLIGRSLDNVFRGNYDYFYLKFRKGEQFTLLEEDNYIINRSVDLGEYKTFFNVCIIANDNEIRHTGNVFFLKVFMVGVFFYFVLWLMVFFLRKYYVGQIIQLTDKSRSMTDVDNEYGQNKGLYIPELRTLDLVLARYHKTFVKIKQLNREIEEHKYSDTLDTLPKENRFQQSYNKMLETLRSIAMSESERKKREEHENWINQGVARINESMRIGTNKVDLLSDNILHTLVDFADAVMGGLYLYRQSDTNEPYLELISAIALGKKKALRIKIERGIGLVGTCALERKPIILNNLPDDYVTVVSGLGKSKPRMLAILPLLYDDELIAILEIGFVRNIVDYESEFLNVVAKTVAGTLKTALINEKTEQLMEKFRKQADELAINEQKMSDTIRKLEVEQNKSLEREAYMKSLIDAIDNTILTIEYDTNGILLTANDKYLKTMHYELDDIKGICVLDLVRTEKAELKKVIHDVATTGKHYEKEMKRFTKQGEVRWLYSTYTPYFDVNGKVVKILYFAIDITDSLKHQEELETQIVELQNKIKELTN